MTKNALTCETEKKKPKKGHQNSRSLRSQQRLKLGPVRKCEKELRLAREAILGYTTADRPVTQTQKTKQNTNRTLNQNLDDQQTTAGVFA